MKIYQGGQDKPPNLQKLGPPIGELGDGNSLGVTSQHVTYFGFKSAED